MATKAKTTRKVKKPAKAKVVKAATKTAKATTKVRAAAKRKPAAPKAVKATKRKVATTKGTKTATKTTAKSLSLSNSPVSKKQTKSQIVSELSDMTGVGKSDIRNLFVALRNLVERHMNTKGSGQFAIPELGVKIRRVNKKATKARMGRNPFTGEEIKIPAKPARKAVRATVLKSLKEVV
ncbi:MAG: HU family DNA-binding protein [Gammaproteobacteria bacterium]